MNIVKKYFGYTLKIANIAGEFVKYQYTEFDKKTKETTYSRVYPIENDNGMNYGMNYMSYLIDTHSEDGLVIHEDDNRKQRLEMFIQTTTEDAINIFDSVKNLKYSPIGLFL